MTAREYLNQYRDACRAAKRLRQEYEREYELIDAVRSTADIDGLPRGNGVSKIVEERAVRLADKAAEWKIAELDALHLRQKVFEMAMSVGGDESEVLIERYINLRTWREVCVTVHWSWSKVDSLHKNGLVKVEEKIKQESAH